MEDQRRVGGFEGSAAAGDGYEGVNKMYLQPQRVRGYPRPGDRVTVKWPVQGSAWDGYGTEGVVVQATSYFIAVRAPAGYVFCVPRNVVERGVFHAK